MTRDELRVRSEGALDTAEEALKRLEDVLKPVDWLHRLRARDKWPERIDEAIEQVTRLDPTAGHELSKRRYAVAQLARNRLTELGVDSTATQLDDVFAQLRARSTIASPEYGPPPSKWAAWGIFALAMVGLFLGMSGKWVGLVVMLGAAFLAWIVALKKPPGTDR